MDAYDDLRSLGRGAYASVRLCRRKDNGELVVIKKFHASVAELTPKQRAEMAQEVKLLSHLHHRGVVQFLGSFVEGDVMHVLLEYCAGGSLATYLTHRSGELLPEGEVWEKFVQILSALRYVHKQGVVHRDLKPANVLLSGPGGRIVKLTDFGVSKVLGGADLAATVTGTPHYISPEICSGSGADRKADIWSLGCVLHEMAALRRPFDGSNLPAIIFSIIKSTPQELPRGYSPELRSLVARLLQPNPALRPSASEVEAIPLVQEHMRRWKETLRGLEGGTPPQAGGTGGGLLAASPATVGSLSSPFGSPSPAWPGAGAAGVRASPQPSPLTTAVPPHLRSAVVAGGGVGAGWVTGGATAAVALPTFGAADAAALDTSSSFAAAPLRPQSAFGGPRPGAAPSELSAASTGVLPQTAGAGGTRHGLAGRGLGLHLGPLQVAGPITAVGGGVDDGTRSGGGGSSSASPGMPVHGDAGLSTTGTRHTQSALGVGGVPFASPPASSVISGFSSLTPSRSDPLGPGSAERMLLAEIEQVTLLVEQARAAAAARGTTYLGQQAHIPDTEDALRRLEDVDSRLLTLTSASSGLASASSASGAALLSSGASLVTPAASAVGGSRGGGAAAVTGKVWDAMGRAWADLGQWTRAIAAYRRALRAKGSLVPLTAMEQLGNLLVRRAQQVWAQARSGDSEGARQGALEALEGSSSSSAVLQRLAARQAAGDEDVARHHGHHATPVEESGEGGLGSVSSGVGGQLTGCTSPAPSSPSTQPSSNPHEPEGEPPSWYLGASALMFEGIAYIERICAIGSTAERRSLLGSAYKRRAWTGLGASRREDLLAAARNYATAAGIEADAAGEGGTPGPYARLNQLTCELLASSGEDGERRAILSSLRVVEEVALARRDCAPEDVWLWVQAEDVRCLRLLLGPVPGTQGSSSSSDNRGHGADTRGGLGVISAPTLEEVIAGYREQFAIGATQRVKSSVMDTLSFYACALEGRLEDLEDDARKAAGAAGVPVPPGVGSGRHGGGSGSGAGTACVLPAKTPGGSTTLPISTPSPSGGGASSFDADTRVSRFESLLNRLSSAQPARGSQTGTRSPPLLQPELQLASYRFCASILETVRALARGLERHADPRGLRRQRSGSAPTASTAAVTPGAATLSAVLVGVATAVEQAGHDAAGGTARPQLASPSNAALVPTPRGPSSAPLPLPLPSIPTPLGTGSSGGGGGAGAAWPPPPERTPGGTHLVTPPHGVIGTVAGGGTGQLLTPASSRAGSFVFSPGGHHPGRRHGAHASFGQLPQSGSARPATPGRYVTMSSCLFSPRGEGIFAHSRSVNRGVAGSGPDSLSSAGSAGPGGSGGGSGGGVGRAAGPSQRPEAFPPSSSGASALTAAPSPSSVMRHHHFLSSGGAASGAAHAYHGSPLGPALQQESSTTYSPHRQQQHAVDATASPPPQRALSSRLGPRPDASSKRSRNASGFGGPFDTVVVSPSSSEGGGGDQTYNEGGGGGGGAAGEGYECGSEEWDATEVASSAGGVAMGGAPLLSVGHAEAARLRRERRRRQRDPVAAVAAASRHPHDIASPQTTVTGSAANTGSPAPHAFGTPSALTLDTGPSGMLSLAVPSSESSRGIITPAFAYPLEPRSAGPATSGARRPSLLLTPQQQPLLQQGMLGASQMHGIKSASQLLALGLSPAIDAKPYPPPPSAYVPAPAPAPLVVVAPTAAPSSRPAVKRLPSLSEQRVQGMDAVLVPVEDKGKPQAPVPPVPLPGLPAAALPAAHEGSAHAGVPPLPAGVPPPARRRAAGANPFARTTPQQLQFHPHAHPQEVLPQQQQQPQEQAPPPQQQYLAMATMPDAVCSTTLCQAAMRDTGPQLVTSGAPLLLLPRASAPSFTAVPSQPLPAVVVTTQDQRVLAPPLSAPADTQAAPAAVGAAHYIKADSGAAGLEAQAGYPAAPSNGQLMAASGPGAGARGTVDEIAPGRGRRRGRGGCGIKGCCMM